MRHTTRIWMVAMAALLGVVAFGPTATAQETAANDAGNGMLKVYLIDHQLVSREEMSTIRREIEQIFKEQAGVAVDWITDDSPRRKLHPDELRVLVLASDGTRWFHGPSNVIGLAPHDETGIGRNCFVFYRQALWFRQQAVLRCREATRVRTQAEVAGTDLPEDVDAIAPQECGDFLPSLTPMIVARAAAHEMVHILLNKLDHSETGLMRESFELREWLGADLGPFRLLPEEVTALQQHLSPSPAASSDR